MYHHRSYTATHTLSLHYALPIYFSCAAHARAPRARYPANSYRREDCPVRAERRSPGRRFYLVDLLDRTLSRGPGNSRSEERRVGKECRSMLGREVVMEQRVTAYV